MTRKKYLLGGWIPPILHLRDPDYCEHGCPVCSGARRGNRIARMLQKIELGITGGGCPWGKARKEKYGVAPNEHAPTDET